MDPRDPSRTPVEEPVEVVRSEEELRLGVRVVAHERVRLVKRVVSETVTRTFEVRREELYMERLPLDAEPSDLDGALAPGEVADIVLHEEEVELVSRIVPRERVRVRKELVTEQHPVSDTVRREQIELETDPGVRSSPTSL